MRQLDLCRCCLAVGCDKDISEEYEEDGRKEVYSDMLLDTFNIFISYEDVGGKCQICEECISRLREAAAFKEQVIAAGKAIAHKLRHTKLEFDDEEVTEGDIKTEGCEDVELGYEDFDLDALTAGTDDDEIYIIKLEEPEPATFAETMPPSEIKRSHKRRDTFASKPQRHFYKSKSTTLSAKLSGR